MRTFGGLLKNELKLNIRDMNMVIFAVLMPLVVLLILGMIYKGKPAFLGAEYTFLEQSLGAVCGISICAGGLMGLPIVVSEYRERKILKRFQVTPVSPVMLLGVELVIYVLYAFVSLVTLLSVSMVFFGVDFRGNWLAFAGSWLLTVVSILSIGMMVGGIAKNVKSAGVIASLLYFPMLAFSGTTLPFEIMPVALQRVVAIFPLTHGIQLMKAASLGLPTDHLWTPLAVMAAVTVICGGIGITCFKWE